MVPQVQQYMELIYLHKIVQLVVQHYHATYYQVKPSNRILLFMILLPFSLGSLFSLNVLLFKFLKMEMIYQV